MKKLLLSIVIFISFQITKADPGTYYNGVDTNKTCAALKTELFNKISANTISLSYSSMDDYYFKTDSKPAESGGGSVIVDRYASERPNGLDSCNFRFITNFCGAGGTATFQCSCYVKEHSFPSSWFADQLPMRSDMNFVFPADNYTNNEKSNYPLGYVQTPSSTSYNGTKVGTSNTTLNYGFNATKVFEPADSFKGDFARAYLYVVTRYETLATTWTSNSSANDVLSGNTFPSLDSWILKLCVKWHKLDPPSAFERKRNDSIFSIQNNRNPYIDFPSLVEKAFGVDGSAICVPLGVKQKSNTLNFSVFPNPIKDGMLTIDIERNVTNNASLEVIDIVGRKLIEQKIATNNKQLTIDVSSLAKGTYLLNIIDDGNNSIQKFIKE